MTVYLIRHGQKELEPGDPGLTDVGVSQAIQTGRFLKQFPIDQVYASPLARTQQTAQYISEQLGIDFQTDSSLVERMLWQDRHLSRQEFLHEWVKATHDRDYTPKQGTSSRSTGQRIQSFIKSIFHPQKQVVLVSHGGAILDYLRNEFGDETLKELRKQYPAGEDFQMLNCSINKVSYFQKPKLELLNSVDHLPKPTE